MTTTHRSAFFIRDASYLDIQGLPLPSAIFPVITPNSQQLPDHRTYGTPQLR
jgi:hypothetical protein